MKRWTSLALGAVGILGSRAAEAATNVGPGEVGGQTWTLANSPYVVEGDVTVANGSTLKIEPGVQVVFATADKGATGIDTKLVELTVAGTLLADGTEKQPISFAAPVGTAKGAWYGIVVGANGSASLSFDTIAGATAAVRTNSPNLSLHDVKIGNSVTGVVVTGAANQTLRRLTTTGCTTGVGFLGSAGGTIAESILDSSTSAAVNAQVSGDSSIKISNTVIVGGNAGIVLKEIGIGNTLGVDIIHSSLSGGNGKGIEVSNNPGSTSTITVLNSIVTSWGNAGVELGGAGNTTNTVNISFSDVFGNKLNYLGVTAGPGCISVDPKFAANPPLAIQESSPCKDTANAALGNTSDILGAVRPFGPGYDMGAYEYGSTVPADPPDAGADAGIDAGGTGDDAGPVTDAGGPAPGPDAASGSSSSSSSSSSSTGGVSAAPGDSGINTGVPSIAPAPTSEDDCSVHAIGASGAGGLWLLGAAFTLVARRRRRR